MTMQRQFVRVAWAFALAMPCSTSSAQVLRYTFDEASGNALDTGTGAATESTLEGGATRSSDTPSGTGSSLDLRTDAPYAHLLGPDAAELDGLADLTLTTWLKVETYPDATSGNKRLIAKQGGGTFPGFSWNMNATTNDLNPAAPDHFRLGFFAGDGTAFSFGFSDADAGAADWTFLAVSFDAELGEAKFYSGDVDTPLAQLGSTLVLSPTGPVDGVDARFAVGLTDAANTSDTSVTGLQDDVRVYNTILDLAALDAVRLENLGSAPVLAADFNNDTKVDDVDFGVWKTNFGTATGAGKPQGNADADMDVDGEDFLIWQGELGAGTGMPLAGAVPEPSSGVMGGVVAASLIWSGSRLRRRNC